jgi:DNA-binding transcriptional regulator GbsR (MarR family)
VVAKLKGTNREQILRWVERAAVFFNEHYGAPLIGGRVLGWLMICDPSEQSAGEIADAIGASRASLTTSLRLLAAAGLVQRHSEPGDRVVRFRVGDDAWEAVVRSRMASLASFRDIAQDGMNLVGPTSARAKRLRAARDSYAWLAAAIANAKQSRTHTESK